MKMILFTMGIILFVWRNAWMASSWYTSYIELYQQCEKSDAHTDVIKRYSIGVVRVIDRGVVLLSPSILETSDIRPSEPLYR